ncbi:MAG: HAD-IIIC family phosphatase [Gammaproteobacteria bacterium]
MNRKDGTVEAVLAAQDLFEVRRALASARVALTLPQAQTLSAHVSGLLAESESLRIGFVHTYTSDLLDPWLELEAAVQGLDVSIYHAPYGLNVMEAEAGSGLEQHRPDLTVLLLRREDLHPELGGPLSRFDAEGAKVLLGDVISRLGGLLQRFSRQQFGELVVTVLPALQGPGLGLHDPMSERSETAWWADFNRALREEIQARFNSVRLLDLDAVVAQLGRERFFDQRFWYSATFPFSPEAAREVARRLVALGAVRKHPKAKVIALDADNTLWGGVVGEDGPTGIALGPEYPGNLFVDFQKRLLEYKQRGFVLVLCSKNNPEDVDQILREHPHCVLKDSDFAAKRVNWVSKPENLASMAKELNLGIDSFIFVDDSDYECAAVRHELPAVEVIQIPKRVVDVPRCLEKVARLEVTSLTAEDMSKTQMYVQERKRRELQNDMGSDGGDLTEYLKSLELRMSVGVDDMAHVKRLAQLTQKTNQFNLTTRRYTEKEIEDMIRSPDWRVLHFSLVDVFGDSGVVGLALARRSGADMAMIDTLLMSCRVIGRMAETAFLYSLLDRLAGEGVREVRAEYLPTRKNALVKDYLRDHGFEEEPDGTWRIDPGETSGRLDPPIEIVLTGQV